MRVVGVFACRYRVHLAYAGANKPRLDEAIDIQAATDDGRPRNHHVSFNRAVAASQAFGRKFPDVDQLLENHKTLAIEKWPKAA